MSIRNFDVYRIEGQDYYYDPDECCFVPAKSIPPKDTTFGAQVVPEESIDLALEERVV